MYNSKNYSTDGGDTLVIGGKLVIEDGAEVEGLNTATSAHAEYQPFSTATTVKEAVSDLNDLISKLQKAGLMSKR